MSRSQCHHILNGPWAYVNCKSLVSSYVLFFNQCTENKWKNTAVSSCPTHGTSSWQQPSPFHTSNNNPVLVKIRNAWNKWGNKRCLCEEVQQWWKFPRSEEWQFVTKHEQLLHRWIVPERQLTSQKQWRTHKQHGMHLLQWPTQRTHKKWNKKGREGGGGSIEHGKECPNMKLWLIKESKKKKKLRRRCQEAR